MKETNESIAANIANEITRVFGICKSDISISTTNGYSVYFLYKGHKVRVSDHDTQPFSGRHISEIQCGTVPSIELLEREVYLRNPDNYVSEMITVEYIGTEHSARKYYGKRIVSIEPKNYVGKSKKGNDIYLFNVVLTTQKLIATF